MKKEKPYYDIRVDTDRLKITIRESDNKEWLNKYYKGNGVRGTVCKKEKLAESKLKVIQRLFDETSKEISRLQKDTVKLMRLEANEKNKITKNSKNGK